MVVRSHILLLLFIILLQTVYGQRLYTGASLSRVAFPIGGIGAGIFCLEGSGAIGQFSIRNRPDLLNEPPFFAAIAVKDQPAFTRVIEGPVPDWKKYGQRGAATGAIGATWGLPRFTETISFEPRFPFATIRLKDKRLPMSVSIRGWSPFIPTDADNSSLPVGALQYTFTNTGDKQMEYTFSYSARLFDDFSKSNSIQHGFVLSNGYNGDNQARLAVYTDAADTKINQWARGANVFDVMARAWNDIQHGIVKEDSNESDHSGASLIVPFKLKPDESRSITVFFNWYVPGSKLHAGQPVVDKKDSVVRDASVDIPSKFYKPCYSKKFGSIQDVIEYWKKNYASLKQKTEAFTDSFYNTTLSPAVIEAVAANLSILKSPTVLRQYDGRLWGYEGCSEGEGLCGGTTTHVWNYAQSICHLFPALERGLRETEFNESQNADGHQAFRAALPIRPLMHDFYAAADGQLGGILKVYRDWRILGDGDWLKKLYPKVKLSIDYCIQTWDPEHKGIIEQPHHNTYDIEFIGAEPMCTGFYLGALEAMIKMTDYLKQENSLYKDLFARGKVFMEKVLYNGQYFQQVALPDSVKYQYGKGCLSDGMIGAWMTSVCGITDPFINASKLQSHLSSVYQYNFKKDLSTHSNPQRSTYALGKEGGLLLCSWPKGGKPTLPFIYSDEVWTGIEYEVASHLIFSGKLKEGLEMVLMTRSRYNGKVRNPFDEYEYGHYYARAMSSYALIEACTGVRYDAVTKTLFVDSKVGNFTSFLSTNIGFGNVIYKNGKAKVKVVYGTIPIEHYIIRKS